MVEPLSLEEVKLNLRVDDDDQDELIGALITTARQQVENNTGLLLTPRAVTETAARLGRWIDLVSWPVTAVTAIRYPLAGVMTPLAGGSWLVSQARRPVRILPAAIGWGIGAGPWGLALPYHPVTLPIEIDVTAGYATTDDVPRALKHAMHLLVAHWFGNRSAAEVGLRAAAVEIPLGVADLLRPYQIARA